MHVEEEKTHSCTARLHTVLRFDGLSRGDYYINETIARLFILFEHINSKAQLETIQINPFILDVQTKREKKRNKNPLQAHSVLTLEF